MKHKLWLFLLFTSFVFSKDAPKWHLQPGNAVSSDLTEDKDDVLVSDNDIPEVQIPVFDLIQEARALDENIKNNLYGEFANPLLYTDAVKKYKEAYEVNLTLSEEDRVDFDAVVLHAINNFENDLNNLKNIEHVTDTTQHNLLSLYYYKAAMQALLTDGALDAAGSYKVAALFAESINFLELAMKYFNDAAHFYGAGNAMSDVALMQCRGLICKGNMYFEKAELESDMSSKRHKHYDAIIAYRTAYHKNQSLPEGYKIDLHAIFLPRINQYQEKINAFKNINSPSNQDKANVAIWYNLQGHLYNSLPGKSLDAAVAYESAAELYEQVQDNRKAMGLYTQASELYVQVGDFAKAQLTRSRSVKLATPVTTPPISISSNSPTVQSASDDGKNDEDTD